MLNSVFGQGRNVLHQDGDAGQVPEPIGKPAPPIEATDLEGRTFSSGDWRGRRTALLWVSPDCVSCKLTLPELEALHEKVHGNLVVICRSTQSRCAQMAEEYGLRIPVLADEGDRVSKRFGIDIAPTAVLVAEDGTIESIGHPLSGDELERLIVNQNGAPAGIEVVIRHGA